MNNTESLDFSNCIDVPLLNDFDILHRTVKYKFNSHLLCSLSPVVADLVFSEPPVMSLEIPSLKGNFKIFQLLAFGADIKIDETNCRFLRFIGEQLRIFPLIQVCNGICEKTSTIKNIVDFAEECLHYNVSCKTEISLISSNVDKILNLTTIPFSNRLFEQVFENEYLSDADRPHLMQSLAQCAKEQPSIYLKTYLKNYFPFDSDVFTLFESLSTISYS